VDLGFIWDQIILRKPIALDLIFENLASMIGFPIIYGQWSYFPISRCPYTLQKLDTLQKLNIEHIFPEAIGGAKRAPIGPPPVMRMVSPAELGVD
jgi:hypothetical protein